jgi:hypothetical protein
MATRQRVQRAVEGVQAQGALLAQQGAGQETVVPGQGRQQRGVDAAGDQVADLLLVGVEQAQAEHIGGEDAAGRVGKQRGQRVRVTFGEQAQAEFFQRAEAGGQVGALADAVGERQRQFARECGAAGVALEHRADRLFGARQFALAMVEQCRRRPQSGFQCVVGAWRFASVYKNFEDLAEFQDAIAEVGQPPKPRK